MKAVDGYLGVDLGTSGCRAVAVDVNGRELAWSRQSMPAPRRERPGVSEQDPQIWWQAVTAVLADLASRLGNTRPRALCLDATATTVLSADAQGRPLGPALMYDDVRAANQLARIGETAPAECPVHAASSSLAKALFLQSARRLPAGGRIFHQADWLLGRLSGRFRYSDWNNCLRLGFDPAATEWPAWLDNLGLDPGEQFPQVVAPGRPIGTLADELARPLQLPADLVVCAGTTDSTASVLAAGVSEPGDGVTVLGSTLVLKILSPAPVNAPEYGVYSHRLGRLWLAGGASNTGGAVLRSLFDEAEIQALSERIDPLTPSGFDYYPLCRPGERFPINDPSLPPRLSPAAPDRLTGFQAVLEGIAEVERRGYGLLQALGAPRLRRVTDVGGGAANVKWRKMRQRLLGVPVAVAPHQDAAYGTALLARDGLARQAAAV